MPIFQSIPGLNGLMDVNKKEMLLNKIMSNIYSNGSIEKQLTFSKRWFSKSKKCISVPVFASPCQLLKLLVGTYISKKEINVLFNKRMPNIYSNGSMEKKLTFSKLLFFKCKKCISIPVFGELQLTQISLNFKVSCCNLKIRRLGKNSCEAFFYYCFVFEIFHFKQNCTPFFHVKRRWI